MQKPDVTKIMKITRINAEQYNLLTKLGYTVVLTCGEPSTNNIDWDAMKRRAALTLVKS